MAEKYKPSRWFTDVFCARSLYAFDAAVPCRWENAQHDASAFALSL